MILYNVTVNIDNDIREEWLQWMKDVHIPDVLNTGLFVENKIFQVMADDEGGTTYSIQYTLRTMGDLESYQKEHAPRLQKEHTDRYRNKFVAFRTILQQV